MSSRLLNYARKEEQLRKLREELQELESDEGMKRDLQFKEELNKLLKKFDQDPVEVAQMLDPGRENAFAAAGYVPQKRAPRKTKIYKHPETGQVVESKGGHNKTLKAWKDEHGREKVEGWVVEVRD